MLLAKKLCLPHCPAPPQTLPTELRKKFGKSIVSYHHEFSNGKSGKNGKSGLIGQSGRLVGLFVGWLVGWSVGRLQFCLFTSMILSKELGTLLSPS